MTEQEKRDAAFVEKWIEASKNGLGTAWVASELGLSQRYIVNKAGSLKRRGVKLPVMRRGVYTITPKHVENLNKLIEEKNGRND